MKTVHYSESTLDINFLKETLDSGEVIGFPTETVYGLGALISNEKGLNEIYKLKNRPKEKSFIVHIGRLDQVEMIADEIPGDFYELAKYFFPGPLTLILRKKRNLSSLVSSSDTVAVRMPSHPLILKLLKALPIPIAGTSANISSNSPITDFLELKKIFDGKVSALIDGGPGLIKIPSTILSLVGDKRILREGLVSKEQLENILNIKILP